MDAETRARWDALHQQWWKDLLADSEREARRRAWRRRHPWLIRSGIGIALAIWIGICSGLGYWIGHTPQTINVHVDAPRSGG